MNYIFDIETNGLEPVKENHRVTCITLMRGENILTYACEDEKEILEQFWLKLEDDDALINFNGDEFDIPFIITRSLINNVPIKRVRSIDLRKLVNGFKFNFDKFKSGSLDKWGTLLGQKEKLENGLVVVGAFNRRDWDTVIKHCVYDVKLTKLLYDRCVLCRLL